MFWFFEVRATRLGPFLPTRWSTGLPSQGRKGLIYGGYCPDRNEECHEEVPRSKGSRQRRLLSGTGRDTCASGRERSGKIYTSENLGGCLPLRYLRRRHSDRRSGTTISQCERCRASRDSYDTAGACHSASAQRCGEHVSQQLAGPRVIHELAGSLSEHPGDAG